MLVLKTGTRDLRWLTRWGGPRPTWLSLAELRWRSGSKAPVRLLTDEFSEAQIRGLHARGDCYVSLAHGEGWAMGTFDAAAAGKPAVVTGYGGPLDYLGSDYPFLVRQQSAPTDAEGEDALVFSPEQHWAMPDEADAAEKMREVFARPESAREAVRAVVPRLRSEYGSKKVVAELLRVLANGKDGN
jgi:glycosyltransferase involved in cell wall biosynthesis